jgi:hypothetical protein
MANPAMTMGQKKARTEERRVLAARIKDSSTVDDDSQNTTFKICGMRFS